MGKPSVAADYFRFQFEQGQYPRVFAVEIFGGFEFLSPGGNNGCAMVYLLDYPLRSYCYLSGEVAHITGKFNNTGFGIYLD